MGAKRGVFWALFGGFDGMTTFVVSVVKNEPVNVICVDSSAGNGCCMGVKKGVSARFCSPMQAELT